MNKKMKKPYLHNGEQDDNDEEEKRDVEEGARGLEGGSHRRLDLITNTTTGPQA